MTDDANVDDVEPLVTRIGAILAGRHPTVQGAVLADLLAIWLAGHHSETGDTGELREKLLEQHLALVRDLIKPNEHMGLIQQMLSKRGRRG